jgi:hypothetical protein
LKKIGKIRVNSINNQDKIRFEMEINENIFKN